jgi:hypothetical protein
MCSDAMIVADARNDESTRTIRLTNPHSGGPVTRLRGLRSGAGHQERSVEKYLREAALGATTSRTIERLWLQDCQGVPVGAREAASETANLEALPGAPE